MSELSNAGQAPARTSPGVSVAAAGILAAALMAPQKARAVTPALTFNDIPGTGDIKVLNYALALEDLEADLYAQALQRLTTGGANGLGTIITGLGIGAGEIDVTYVRRYSQTEAEHRNFLRTTLGAAAIHPFQYDFHMQNLSRRQVIELVYTAEKTGVGAYLGAIKFLSTRQYLQIAAAIQGTEARHTAVFALIQNELYSAGINPAPLATENKGIDQPIEPDSVLSQVSPFIVVTNAQN